MTTFRTLDLAVQFYEEVENLKVQGHLRDQFLRAASSISLNLSEGNAKYTIKEKKRFYAIAYASLKECRTIIKLLKLEENKINRSADHLGACLYKLIDSQLTTVKSY